MITIQFLLRILLIAVCLTASVSAQCQPETTASASAQTTETLTSLLAELDAARQRAEQLKAADSESPVAAEMLNLLTQAREQLQVREQATSDTTEHQQAVREAPAMLERVKAELAKQDTETTALELPTTASAEFLEQHIAERRAELGALEQRLADVHAEQARRTTRLAQIPTELTAARSELNSAEFAAAAAPGTEDPAVAQARNLLARARIRAANARIENLQREQERYAAREELLPLADQLITERLAAKTEQLTALTERLNSLRRQEASASALEIKQAEREVDRSHPLVRAVAAENTSYTEQLNLAGIIEDHETLLRRLDEVRKEAERTSSTFTSLKEKFAAVGFSDALGLLLRKQRKELPNRRSHREALSRQETTLAEVNLKSLEIQDELTALADPATVARDMVAVQAPDATTSQALQMRREITDLLKSRRDYLVQVREQYDDYFRTLIDLNSAEDNLVRVATAYAEFIDERILWLPSAERVNARSVAMAWQSLGRLLNVDLWRNYGSAWTGQAKMGSPYLFGFLLLFLLISVSRRRWKSWLHSILETAAKNRLAAFRPVMQALLFAALISAPIPLVLLLMGAPLANRFDVSVDVAGVANGFVRAAIILFILILARKIIKRKGIAEVFFVWPETALAKLRHTFSALLWIFLPTVFIVRLSEVTGGDPDMESARLILAAALLGVAILTAQLLRPKSTVLAGTEAYKPGTWLFRLRYVLFIVFPLAFVTLAIACLAGYVYTSIELSQRLNMSFWLGVGALLLNEIIFFWVLVKRRRLAIEEARRRREAAKAQQSDSASGVPYEVAPAPTEPAIDIAAISRQVGRLLHVFVLGVFVVGLWIVWDDVLPALRYLDTHPLWNVSRAVTETGAGGVSKTVNALVPVTIADVLLAIFCGFLAVVAIRNIPGLLDITVFQKFSVQSGERYAFNTIIRYIIILIGIVYIFSTLGLQWSQIQWLAAAVSVGLGFGLQEIFANFVSGLILLFERPVRVGDVVSVGEVTGKVTQIRIRATTIVNWDHKEHIIPNKEFITGQVLNWTLSDKMVRLVINVGVAYGSDYDKVREILLKIIKENPHTLDDPAPFAAIDKFGPGSVDFVLHAHLPNLDNMGDVKHDTIARIERELTAAGIEIPYPKLDVRIDRVKHDVPK